MWLKKDSGGTTINWQGAAYHWPAGDPVCEVPAGLGHELLSIKGAGYTEVLPPPKPAPKAAPAKAADPAPK
jgi:hypothetical protein